MKLKYLIFTGCIAIAFSFNSCQPSLPSSVTTSKVFLNLPKDMESLGRGYNIYGEYASPTSLKYSLFDFSQDIDEGVKHINIDDNIYQLPHIIEVSNQRIKKETMMMGNSAEEISKEMSAELKIGVDYMLFSGSVEGKYGSKMNSNKEYFYMNHIDATVLRKYDLNINFSNEQEVKILRKYLRKEAQLRLNDTNIPVKEVFDLYGSHFLANCYIGAKAVVNSSTEKMEGYSETEIAAAVEAEISKVTVEVKYAQNERSRNIAGKTSMNFSAIGGKSSLLRSDGSGYMDWAQSIETNSVLCDFDDKSLVPIWVLCKDAHRAKQLEDYFYDSYILKEQYNFLDKIKKGTKVFTGNFTNKGKNEFIYFDDQGLVLVNQNGMSYSIGNYNMKFNGGWILGYDDIVGVGDFNGDKKADIVLKSWWGIGILTMNENNTLLKCIFSKPFDGIIENYKLNEDKFTVGNFLYTDKASLLSMGKNGLYILDYEKADNGKLVKQKHYPIGTASLKPGTSKWLLTHGDQVFKIDDFNDDEKNDLVIQSSTALGLLTFKNNDFEVNWSLENENIIGKIKIDPLYEFYSLDLKDNLGKPLNLIPAIKRRPYDTLNKLAFFTVAPNPSGLTSYYTANYNDNLAGWNLRNDHILGTIMIDKKSAIIIESDWGRGLLQINKSSKGLKFENIYLSKFK